jgi:hypothetical protein
MANIIKETTNEDGTVELSFDDMPSHDELMAAAKKYGGNGAGFQTVNQQNVFTPKVAGAQPIFQTPMGGIRVLITPGPGMNPGLQGVNKNM